MSENPFTFEILAEYGALYDGDIPELPALLTGISRDKLLQIAAFFLGFYNRKSVLASPYELLSKFRPENNEFVNDLWKRIQALQNSSEQKVRLISPQTALLLFEYAYDHLDDTETQTHVEIEVSIIKAVLVQNEINTRKQEQSGPTTEHITSLLRYPLWNLTQSFAYSELINYSIAELWACQLIKSVSLFQFLASQERMQPLLQAFLAYYHVPDWETYLKKVIPLTLSALKNQREAQTDIVVQKDEHLADNIAFLEKLIIKNTEALSDSDFRKTRSKPFYWVDELTCRIIFNPFVIETLYKGLYFKLNEINATLPGHLQFKNLRSLLKSQNPLVPKNKSTCTIFLYAIAKIINFALWVLLQFNERVVQYYSNNKAPLK